MEEGGLGQDTVAKDQVGFHSFIMQLCKSSIGKTIFMLTQSVYSLSPSIFLFQLQTQSADWGHSLFHLNQSYFATISASPYLTAVRAVPLSAAVSCLFTWAQSIGPSAARHKSCTTSHPSLLQPSLFIPSSPPLFTLQWEFPCAAHGTAPLNMRTPPLVLQVSHLWTVY